MPVAKRNGVPCNRGIHSTGAQQQRTHIHIHAGPDHRCCFLGLNVYSETKGAIRVSAKNVLVQLVLVRQTFKLCPGQPGQLYALLDLPCCDTPIEAS